MEAYYKVDEGMSVVDAGAYTGLFTLKSSKVVGRDGVVISLEPFPAAFRVLSYNVKKNKLKNVILLKEGLWSSTCFKKLMIDKSYIGNRILEDSSFPLKNFLASLFRLYHIHMKHNIRLIEVKLTTLDKLLTRFNLEQIDFLKMDIEGSELEALRAYTEIVKGNILVLETHRNLEAVLHQLVEKGYSMQKTYVVPVNSSISIVHTISEVTNE